MHVMFKHVDPHMWMDRGHAVRIPWACVKVMVTGTKKSPTLTVVPGFISVLKPDALVMKLHDSIKVLDEDGEVIESERGGFYITTETFDPCHLIIDGMPSWSPER